jgi:hypothetical protein
VFKDAIGPSNIFADGSVEGLGLKKGRQRRPPLGAGFGKQTWPSLGF